jgi:hypothetical protein
MSFILKGPYPGLQTTTLLPSPKWGDSKALTATVTSLRTMDGTLFTYVKSRNGRKKFQWEFEIARNKALELREFINSYQGTLIHITDHDGDTWIGYLRNNPFEFTGAGRAGPTWPGNETMSIILEFEQR